MRILGRTSSINVRKVLWTADEAGMAYDREDWGAGFRPTSSPEFLALNPNAQVPVLVDGDFVLWESNAICRYLAREAPALLPADARRRADVERWMDWQATELNTVWRYAFMALVRRSPAHADASAIAHSVREWNRLMTLLDRQLAATGGYVTGAGFTLADIVLGLSAHRWRHTPMERPALPAVAAWEARLSARPAWAVHARPEVP